MKISRRDTAIIAVLVNVALLAILFATSSTFSGEKEELSPEKAALLQKELSAQDMFQASGEEKSKTKEEAFASFSEKPLPLAVFSPPEEKNPTDEIDIVLQEYALKQKIVTSDTPQDSEKKIGTRSPKENDTETLELQEVIVKQGDALSKIAKVYGVKVEEIIKINNLESAKLRIGQVLKIPKHQEVIPSCIASENSKLVLKKEEKSQVKSGKAIGKNSTKKSDKQTTGPEYYVIKSGDNPWKIARKFHLKYEELLQLNELNEDKARNLKIGQKIRIR
jgi:peptidoglycan DL-endopeptidase LytF